jgi:hypothetical protein
MNKKKKKNRTAVFGNDQGTRWFGKRSDNIKIGPTETVCEDMNRTEMTPDRAPMIGFVMAVIKLQLP